MKRFLALTITSALLTSTVIYAETDANSSATAGATETNATSIDTSTTTVTVTPVMPVMADLASFDNPEGYQLYVVQPGDNLSKIAYKHGTHWTVMAELNGIQNRPSTIWPGEIFMIPGTAGMMLPQVEDKTIITPITPEVDPIPPVEVEDKSDLTKPNPKPEVEVEDKSDLTKPNPKPETTPDITPVETRNLKNGHYVAMNGMYSKDEPLDNWDYFVEIDVLDGMITDVNWDAKSEMNSTMTKKALSANGEYGMINKSEIGVSWADQAKIVEDAFLKAQSTDVFEVEDKKLVSIDGVDATSMVTIKVDKFIEYADMAVDKSRGNFPATANVDAMSTASLTVDADTLVQALSAEGNWLVAGLGDIVVNEPIVIDGDFHNKNDETKDLYRKFTVSNHVYDAEGNRDRNQEELYTLTAKEGIIVKSPMAKIANSIIVGDIMVESMNFTLDNVTLFGNVEFASQEARDSATLKNVNVIGGEVTPMPTNALVDGVYTATSEITEDSKYQDEITVTVRFGQIADVDYNAYKVIDGEITDANKQEMAAAGEYVLPEGSTATWAEQAGMIEDYIKGMNDLTVDAVSGVTISVDSALETAMKALEQAK